MKSVILERHGEIGWLTMSRPEALNAFDERMSAEMLETLKELRNDRSVRVAVLCGRGRAFSTGIDLKALGSGGIEIGWFRNWHRILHELEDLEIPLVIAAQGHCLGGGLMLLLTGDYRVAADDFRTGLSAVKHGIIPGSAPYRLASAVGALAARRLCLFCEFVDAAEALRIGLVDKVVPVGQLERAAREVAEDAARFSPVALKETKRLIASASVMKRDEYEQAYLQAQQRCLASGHIKPWSSKTGR
jgi:enoyl-CoA hydratase/carnithine racemase